MRFQADVLDQIAKILDDMSHTPNQLAHGDEAEVVVAVTLRASLCDLDDEVNMLDLRSAASEAVGNAVRHHEQEGFDHALADRRKLVLSRLVTCMAGWSSSQRPRAVSSRNQTA